MKISIRKNLKIGLIFAILFISFTCFSQGWIQIWSDEFNTDGLPDSQKWSYETGCGLVNSEAENYTANDTNNARVRNGNLIIEARKGASGKCSYSSARIKTQYKGDWLYGRMEARIKIPTGKGMWPAFWMMPSDSYYGGWPSSGEIDIMENVGYDPNRIYHTIHVTSSNAGSNELVTLPYDDYHIYALEWDSTHLDFFVDSLKEFTYTKGSNADYKLWPFDKRFYIILNVAIGGSWGGTDGIDNSIFPQNMYVDYVRVYQWQPFPGPFTINITPDTLGTVVLDSQQTLYPSGTPLKITAIPKNGYRFVNWTVVEPEITNVNDNPLNISVNNSYHLKPNYLPACEQVLNGDFSSAKDNWNMVMNDGSQYTADVVNGELLIQLTNKGTYNWSAQLLEPNIRIVNGKNYNLSFDAYSTANRSIDVFAGLNVSPWTNYIIKTAALTTQKQTFSYNFTMTYATDTIARVGFNLSEALNSIYIDNVSLCNTDVTSVNEKNVKQSSFTVVTNNAEKFLKIYYSIPADENVEVSIFDMMGKIIYNIEKGKIKAGDYTMDINYGNLNMAAGVYLVKFSTQQENNIQKIFIR